MQGKHWMLLAGFLTATGAVLSGMHDWTEAVKPAVVGGLLAQVALVLTAMFSDKPAPKE